MIQVNQKVRKYLFSTAFVSSLIFTPLLGGEVFASAGAGASEGEITFRESKEQVVVSEKELEKVQHGDVGENVENLQVKLQELGYYPYAIDGIFGPLTGQAVKDYQADQNGRVDGKVSQNSIEVMSLPETDQKSTMTEPEGNSSLQSDIVATAKDVIGTPYAWGGTTRAGMDSSGFINYVFQQVGLDHISRTHRDMWVNDGVHVDQPSVGDVVFFEGTYNTDGASHSGVYIGDNKMIHSGNDGVSVADISIDYWQNHYIGAKSFVE